MAEVCSLQRKLKLVLKGDIVVVVFAGFMLCTQGSVLSNLKFELKGDILVVIMAEVCSTRNFKIELKGDILVVIMAEVWSLPSNFKLQLK